MKKVLILVFFALIFAFGVIKTVDASIVDFKEYKTDFMITAKSNLKTAKSYWNMTVADDGFKIDVAVADERIILKDDFEYSDGVYLRFSVLGASNAKFAAGKTSELRVKSNGTFVFKRYSSGAFRDTTSNVRVSHEDLVDENVQVGYKLTITIPYEDLKVTKDTAKGLLTFAPFLCNENIDSKAIKGSLGYNDDYDYSADDQRTYIIVNGDNKFKNNTGSHDTGAFTQVTQNTCWDISEDYADGNSARRVTLNGTNGQDNHLRFFGSNAEKLYVHATFRVTDVYRGEQYGKYGFEFKNKAGNGVFIVLEAASPSGDKMGARAYQPAGYVIIRGGGYDWTTYKTVGGNYNCVSESVDFGVYRDNDTFYIFVDGRFITAIAGPGGLTNDKIYPELVSFNIGLEVTKYAINEDTDELDEMLKGFTGDGYVFKAPSLAMSQGRCWDLSADKEGESGTVVLTGHDGADNNLYFNTGSTSNGFLYAKARIQVTGINQPDYWPKYGLCLFDGSGAKGIFLYVDAAMSNQSQQPSLSLMTGKTFGYNTFTNSWGAWTLTGNKVDNNKDVMMELVYGGGYVYLLCDGKLVIRVEYSPSKQGIYAGFKSFGLKLEVSDYYATNDFNDATIQDSIAKIDGLTVGTSGGTMDINTIISQIPDEEEIIPNDPSVVGDYGLLTIKTLTCYVGNGAKQIIPVFSNPLAKEKITYTYNSDNIVIKNGYVVGIKGGTSTVVTATTPHLETKFIVKVNELNQRFISDYEYFLEEQKTRNVKDDAIIFFGDSFFDQRVFWTNFYRDCSPKNAGDQVYITGIGGTTMEQWLGYAEHLVYDLKPSSLVIHLGTNDMFDTQLKENSCINVFKQFVSELHLNLPDCKIYYIGIENRSYSIPGTSMDYTIDYLKSMNVKMKAYCADKDYITFIDSFEHFTNSDGTCKTEIFKDGVHPVNEEYGYYLDRLIEAGLPIVNNMTSASTTDKFTSTQDLTWSSTDTIVKKDNKMISTNALIEFTMNYSFDTSKNAHFGIQYGNGIDYRLLIWNSTGTGLFITAANGTYHGGDAGLTKLNGTSGSVDVKVLTTQDSIYMYIDGKLEVCVLNTTITTLHIAAELINVNINNISIKDNNSADYQALLANLSEYEAETQSNKFVNVK